MSPQPWQPHGPQPLPARAAHGASAQGCPERESSLREKEKTAWETLEKVHGRRSCWKHASRAVKRGAFAELFQFWKLITPNEGEQLWTLGLLHLGYFLNLLQPVSLTHSLSYWLIFLMKTKNKCFGLASGISHYQPGGLWVRIATTVVRHSSFQYDSKLSAFWKRNTADIMLQINARQDTKCSRRKQFSSTNLKLVLLHSFSLHQHHVKCNSENFSCIKDKTQNLSHTASTHTHA